MCHRLIIDELQKFSAELAAKERWLILNKSDLLPADQAASTREKILRELGWTGRVYLVSALTGAGTRELINDVMARIEELNQMDAKAEASGQQL